MQLGFNTSILPDSKFSQVLQIASEIGYDCVEVMCWPPGKATRRYAGVTHIDVLELDDVTIDQIKGQCHDHGVTISALGYYPNALSPDTDESVKAVKHILAVIDAAAKLGIGKMNTFIGRDWTKTVDDNWPRFLEIWQPIIAHAQRLEVKVGIENCPMFFTRDEWPGGKNLAHSPAIWSRMFEDIPSDFFGLNYDPSHMIFQQMDYVAPLRDFADKLFHLHAKDIRLDRERLNQVGILAYPNQYHTPKLPGLGDVDWGKFFSTLTDTGFEGAICVEVEDRAYEGSWASCRASLQQSHTYLRNFVPRRS